MKPYLFMMTTILSFTLASKPVLAQAPEKPFIHGVRDACEGVSLKLTGIYSRDEVLCYRLEAQNRSNLVYDVDGLRFSIRDRKVVRRHAFQEVPLEPLWIRGDSLRIGPGKKVTWIIALPKEVLPRGQVLRITLRERHGGRNLEIRVSCRILLRAKIVNEL